MPKKEQHAALEDERIRELESLADGDGRFLDLASEIKQCKSPQKVFLSSNGYIFVLSKYLEWTQVTNDPPFDLEIFGFDGNHLRTIRKIEEPTSFSLSRLPHAIVASDNGYLPLEKIPSFLQRSNQKLTPPKLFADALEPFID